MKDTRQDSAGEAAQASAPTLSTDQLTGLLTPSAFGRQVTSLLSQGGALVVLEIDHLALINERCGHLAGDRVLQEAARAISSLFWTRDIQGRIKGDQFAIFIAGNCTREMVENKTQQLFRWFARVGEEEGIASGITASVGLAQAREGDSVESLLERAQQSRLDSRGGKKAPAMKFSMRKSRAQAGAELSQPLCTDMALIRSQLSEQKRLEGAYCQDYSSFQCIYRFVERGLERTGNSAYVILMTLQQPGGDLPELETRQKIMAQLQDLIRLSLRRGDVFTQYSSGQYILMVLGTNAQNAAVICQRICQKYEQSVEGRGDVTLTGNIYPVKGSRE